MAKRKRKHFGVLSSTIDIANQYDVWKGIVEVAEEKDVHMTAYIGTYQSTDNNFYSYLDSCFDAMFSKDGIIDGLILMSGFIAQNVGLDEFEKYVSRIPRGVPAVSVSFEIPGIPSVVTYNKGGMYSAVDHLIRVHGKRKIAFVKGPDAHPEAEARLQGYKDALKANGLKFDERYLFPGNFGRDGGRNAVRSIYDEKHLDVDAFACCNDQTAVGVMQYLKDRDILVPDDVAVVGFDDDIISSIYVPAIATVGQDFKQLGRVSAQLLVEQTEGIVVDDITRVIPEYIPRQSCGCLGREDLYADAAQVGSEKTDTFCDYVNKHFLELFEADAPAEQIKSWVGALYEQLVRVPFDREAFLTALDRMLVTYYYSYSKEFSSWHKALIALAMGVEIYSDEFESQPPILTTITYATTLVYDIRMSEEKKREYTLNDDRMLKRRNTNALLLMFDVETLADELSQSLAPLTMKTAIIGIFRKPVKSGDLVADRSIENLIGFEGDVKFFLKRTGISPISLTDYTTIKGINYESKRRVMFFHPLFVSDEEVGVMLLPYDPEIATDTYETLRINISTTLKGAQLLSTIHTLSVTDELTGLLNRRGFFQFTYSRLYHLARTRGAVTMVMFMDMDGLKAINDSYGHKEGDNAIRAFAEILKQTMREEDIIGRIGGDEFAAISSVKTKESAKRLEKRLREAYNEYNARGILPYKVDGSIGCVILDIPSKDCFEAAMHRADSVLYEEKQRKKQQGLTR